jgi:hypothetical protein
MQIPNIPITKKSVNGRFEKLRKTSFVRTLILNQKVAPVSSPECSWNKKNAKAFQKKKSHSALNS